LGFQAYVLDKHQKSLSQASSNLYVVVENDLGETIREGMYEVSNGVTNGIIDIDSSFTTGRYKIKAFTNWMRNFNEYNYHSEAFNVIDLKNKVLPDNRSRELDLQVVAEGGYFVDGVPQFAGIVAKFPDGSPAAFEEGELMDANGTIISSFSTNSRGHAKIMLEPQIREPMQVKLKRFNNKASIADIKTKGLVLNIIDLSDRIAVKLSTNEQTLSDIQNKSFQLSIHNGSLAKVLDIPFGSEKDQARLINKSDLYPGMNVLTLFNDSKQPLLERLFFNDQDLPTADIDLVSSQVPEAGAGTALDSIAVSFKIRNFQAGSLGKLSASILPKATKSYNRHPNMLSSVYLQPFLKHYITDAQYFFNQKNPQRKIDLDLLLLTEGWSSYDWNSIFHQQPEAFYNFERGITVRVNVPKTKYDTFVLYTTKSDESRAIQLDREQTFFEHINLFPRSDEKIQIAAIDKKNQPKKLGFAPVFFPRVIPKLSNEFNITELWEDPYFNYPLENDYLDLSSEGYETLEEVILYANYRKERIREKYRKGEITIFDETLKKEYFELGPFLRSQGFVYNNIMDRRFNQAEYGAGRGTSRGRYAVPDYNLVETQVFIDDVRIWNPWNAIIFETDAIDYVVVEKYQDIFGVGTAGMGQYSGNGKDMDNSWFVASVYVHTNRNAYLNKMDAQFYNQYNIPLAFESERRFYTPRYPIYNARFFEDYGVLNWEANIEPDAAGMFTLKVPANYKKDLTVFIEGVVNGQTFISKAIDLEVMSTAAE
jgi:hypothetical protein